MPPPTFRVFIRDADFQRIDELTDWLDLTLLKRFNGTGTWALEVAANSVSAPLLDAASGLIVTRDGETIFSGSAVTALTRTARTLNLAGVDDNVFLEEPARPTPSQATGPYPDEYDVRTGVASSVMRAYVNANIGPSAPVGCKIDALALDADPVLGTTVTGRANFQSLQALLKNLAVTPAAGGLGFEVMQSDTVSGQLDFRIFAPADRTEDAKFGVKLGTASDYSDEVQYPNVNYWVVLGGDGFGVDRTIVEGGDGPAIAAAGRRITGVYDARGISDVGELNQKLAELLAGAIAIRKTVIEPFDVPSLTFGDQWDFGDVVTVVVEGEEIEEVVREVEIQLTNDRGAIITPMIGDAASNNDDTIVQHLKTVRDRLTNIELNWRVPDNSIIAAMLTANAVTEPKLDVLDTPVDNEILTYDSSTGRMEWQAIGALVNGLTIPTLTVTTLTVTTLTVTGLTTVDDLEVNGDGSIDGSLVVNVNLAVDGTLDVDGDSDLQVVRLTPDPGTTPQLQLRHDVSRTFWGIGGSDSATPNFQITNPSGEQFEITESGRVNIRSLDAHPASSETALLVRYVAGQGAITFGATNSGSPDLRIKNNGGSQIGTFTNSGIFKAGSLTTTPGTADDGDIVTSDLWLVDGGNYRRLFANGNAFQISENASSNIDLTIDVNGLMTINDLSVNGNATVGTDLTVGDDFTVNGTISTFNCDVQINAQLEMNSNTIDFDLGGTAGFTEDSWSGYITIRHDGDTKYVPYVSSAPS